MKKSTIFFVLGVLLGVVAIYFVFKERNETEDIIIEDDAETEPEPKPRTRKPTKPGEPINVTLTDEDPTDGNETEQ